MRIVLSAVNFCTEPLPVYPLGMSVIAKVLTAAGHEVRQFDPMIHGRENYTLPLAQLCQDFQPELLGLSIRNIDVADSQSQNNALFAEISSVIDAWRQVFTGPIVLGGSGFSMNPEAVMRRTGADYGVAGEGESAILELVTALNNGQPPPHGTIFRRPAIKIHGACYSQEIANYYQQETHNIPIQTKRGCPFHCSYCTYPSLEGHILRPRPVEEVLQDIALVKKNYPDSMIYFTDSIFNDPARHYEPILQGMVSRGLTMPWTGFITPFGLEAPDIDLLAASGLICADLGIDGTTDTTLAGFGKSFTFAQTRQCCQQLLERHIGVNANAMFGGPGETWDTVRAGIDNMLSLAPVYSIIFSGIRLLSGAPLLATAREQGMIDDDWDDTKPLYYYAPGIDPEKLHQLLLEGFKGSSHCIYPPDSRSDDYRRLHKFGYAKLKALELGQKRRRK